MVNIIGIDLAKRSCQLHGARADGSVAFRRKVSRERLLYILGAQQRCVVAMEACASAHYWGREILKLGHEVRLVPPIYVKPFVKRQKNDAAEGEARQARVDAAFERACGLHVVESRCLARHHACDHERTDRRGFLGADRC